MFSAASSFNESLCSWNMNNVKEGRQMLHGSKCTESTACVKCPPPPLSLSNKRTSSMPSNRSVSQSINPSVSITPSVSPTLYSDGLPALASLSLIQTLVIGFGFIFFAQG